MIAAASQPGATVAAMQAILEDRPQRSEPIDQASLASVLAELADIAAETLELQDVFARVATAIQRLIPLDQMGVVRLYDDQWAVLHAATLPCDPPEPKTLRREDCPCAEALASWSPRIRP